MIRDSFELIVGWKLRQGMSSIGIYHQFRSPSKSSGIL